MIVLPRDQRISQCPYPNLLTIKLHGSWAKLRTASNANANRIGSGPYAGLDLQNFRSSSAQNHLALLSA
jgi:hypothetical protein